MGSIYEMQCSIELYEETVYEGVFNTVSHID